MSLLHQFVYISRADYDHSVYKSMVWDEPGFKPERSNVEHFVEIHDDLLRRFHDFLQWVPSFNPSKLEEQHGLNYYGVTVLDSSHARQLKKVMKSLGELFENATDPMILTGDFCLTDSTYERRTVGKSDLLDFFGGLCSLCDIVIADEGYLLHLGI